MPEVPAELDQTQPTPASWSVDEQPDIDEVYQHEDYYDPTVPVDIRGPVRVQAPGSVSETYRSTVCDDTAGGKLFNADPRRSYATVIGVDQPFYLANTQAEVQATTCAQIPKGVPVTIHPTQRVWARSATPGSTVTVTIIDGRWAR